MKDSMYLIESSIMVQGDLLHLMAQFILGLLA